MTAPPRPRRSAIVIAFAVVVILAASAVGGVIGYELAAESSEKGHESLPVRQPGPSAADSSATSRPAAIADKPLRNVILLVGDGMGLSQIAASRILALGPDARFTFERFPTIGLVATHPADELVTKSDAAATALATGFKTRNGRIGMDSSGRSLPTLIEALRDGGWATGVATTSRITDATPASFLAHVLSRPEENEIALQESAARIDFLAGGGRNFFLPRRSPAGVADGRADGRDLTAEMAARGVDVVADAGGLAAAQRLPVAALFSIEPQKAKPRSPTVDAMAGKALELLSRSGKPFFLLVEEEEIDTSAHAHEGAKLAAALQRFDAAVSIAAEFARRDGATLVLVLADHATGGLTIDSASTARELDLSWASAKHTGEPVPLFAYGPPSAMARFGGMHDNTEIPRLLAAALGVSFPAAATEERERP
ncbi:MAG: alkaline phosphatase [Thermoanaerobaculia bacterium]